MTAKVILGVAAIAAIIVGNIAWTSFDRVDPGYVGVLIDFTTPGQNGQPNIQQVQTGTWMFVGPGKKLVEYPTGQVNTIMDARLTDKDTDDFVPCPAKGGVVLRVDATLAWQVNPTKIVEMFLRHPNVPLKGTIGSDIDSQVVRREITSAFGLVCGQYDWVEIYTTKRSEVMALLEKTIKDRLDEAYLIVNSFAMGNVTPPAAQQTQAAQLIDAQQAAAVARLNKDKIEAEALSNQAQTNATININTLNTQAQANIAKVNAERDATVAAVNSKRDAEVALVNAKRDADVALTAAKRDSETSLTKALADLKVAETFAQSQKITADAISYKSRVEGQANAEALSLQAKAVTKELIDLRLAERWDGKRVPDKEFVMPAPAITVGR